MFTFNKRCATQKHNQNFFFNVFLCFWHFIIPRTKNDQKNAAIICSRMNKVSLYWKCKFQVCHLPSSAVLVFYSVLSMGSKSPVGSWQGGWLTVKSRPCLFSFLAPLQAEENILQVNSCKLQESVKGETLNPRPSTNHEMLQILVVIET